MTDATKPAEETSMTASGSKHGRQRDAQRAREVILDAAETVFAQHGFDGARIEAIARASGYNVSLLFQYFGDKLGLYAAVLERAYRETTALQAQVLGRGLVDETIASHAHQFRAVLESVVQVTFDYLLEHPRLLRILTWEMAEGWQTYAHLASRFPSDESDQQLEDLFISAWRAGWLRSDYSALIQLSLVFQVCQSYLAFLPLYQVMLPDEEVFSERAISRAREHIVRFIVAGMMIDLPQAKEERGRV
jgi:AcrR family transcriptional regulator